MSLLLEGDSEATVMHYIYKSRYAAGFAIYLSLSALTPLPARYSLRISQASFRVTPHPDFMIAATMRDFSPKDSVLPLLGRVNDARTDLRVFPGFVMLLILL